MFDKTATGMPPGLITHVGVGHVNLQVLQPLRQLRHLNLGLLDNFRRLLELLQPEPAGHANNTTHAVKITLGLGTSTDTSLQHVRCPWIHRIVTIMTTSRSLVSRPTVVNAPTGALLIACFSPPNEPRRLNPITTETLTRRLEDEAWDLITHDKLSTVIVSSEFMLPVLPGTV